MTLRLRGAACNSSPIARPVELEVWAIGRWETHIRVTKDCASIHLSSPLNSLQRMPRVLSKPYAERDVEDVESYVRNTVGSISPYIASQEREELVARGIMLVSRMAQALPPEVSLQALLHERLGNSLAVYRWRGARRRTEHTPFASPHAA